jgi:hypothetical protein
MGTYYTAAGKEVFPNTTAEAAQLNTINDAIDTGFQLADVRIEAIGASQSYYADLAESWAANPIDTLVDATRYSALHYAHYANLDATQTAADRVQTVADAATCTSKAASATSSAATATTKASAANNSAIAAAASAETASDAADEAVAAAATFVAVPAGTITAWMGGYFTNGSNAGYTSVLGSSWETINAYCNPKGWYVCNGAELNLGDGSPIFSAAGRYLPNITDDRFLMGDSAAGNIGGNNSVTHAHTQTEHSHTMAHTHTIAHTHNTSAFTLLIADMPAHTHPYNTFDTGAGTVTGDGNAENPIAGTTTSTGGGTDHNHGATAGSNTASSGGVSTASTADSAAVNTGTSAALENRPVFLSCFFIMKVTA